MGDVLCIVCTVMQATCLLNTVLCVKFDVQLVSFDMKLVDNLNNVVPGSVIFRTGVNNPTNENIYATHKSQAPVTLHTKVNNTKSQLKPVTLKASRRHNSHRPPEPHTQPTTQPDSSLDTQSDFLSDSQADTDASSQFAFPPGPQRKSQSESKLLLGPEPVPDLKPDPEYNPDSQSDSKPSHQYERSRQSSPPAQCYQFPKKTHVKFVVTSMKHELTQVFINTSAWLKDRLFEPLRKIPKDHYLNILLETKLNTALQNRIEYIENVSQEMINCYRKTYDETKKRHFKSCMNVNETEELWHKLLTYSSVIIQKMISDCIEGYLTDMKIERKSALGVLVTDNIVVNMKKIKEIILKKMCDKHQLCYGTVYKDNRINFVRQLYNENQKRTT